MSIVLDASVVLAWLLPDEDSPRAEHLIASLADANAQAPWLIHFEVANALLQAQRRNRISRSLRSELLDAFTGLPIAIDHADAGAVARAMEIANRHTLSVYDGAYLELALRRRLALATVDRTLAHAARQEGLARLPEP